MITTEPLRSRRPGVREMLRELLPLIEVIPVAGPPAVALLAPWLLLVLMLVGPFALLVTLCALVAASLVLVAAVATVLASPYLLVRRLRSRRAVEAHVPASTAVLAAAPSRGVGA